MRNVLVTGSSGYMGAKLVRRLLEEGRAASVVGVDLVQPAGRPENFFFYRRDICEDLRDLFARHEIDCAIHLVFLLRPSHDEAAAEHVNVGGARNFLAACESWPAIRTIMLVSSMLAYGYHPDNPAVITEDSPLRGNEDFQYSRDKVAVERLCEQFMARHPDIRFLIPRPAVVIGPNMANVWSDFFARSVLIGTSDSQGRLQFVHEDDLIEAYLLLLEKGETGAYNLGALGTLGIAEIASLTGKRHLLLPSWLLKAYLSVAWPLHLEGSPKGLLPLLMYTVNMSSAKIESLGFRFKYNSKEALMTYFRR